jgi:hypothetical protein
VHDDGDLVICFAQGFMGGPFCSFVGGHVSGIRWSGGKQLLLQVGQLFHFFYGNSTGFVDLQTGNDQLLQIGRYIWADDVEAYLLGHAVAQLKVVEAVLEGSFAMKKFINNNSESPYVCLEAVAVVEETLRRHIEGRADVHVVEWLAEWKGKYLAWTANPKSAILAVPLVRNMLAVLRSR